MSIDTVEETRIRKLYNIFLSCVGDAHDFKTVDKVKIGLSGTKCGYHAWKALKYWYMDKS